MRGKWRPYKQPDSLYENEGATQEVSIRALQQRWCHGQFLEQGSREYEPTPRDWIVEDAWKDEKRGCQEMQRTNDAYSSTVLLYCSRNKYKSKFKYLLKSTKAQKHSPRFPRSRHRTRNECYPRISVLHVQATTMTNKTPLLTIKEIR